MFVSCIPKFVCVEIINILKLTHMKTDCSIKNAFMYYKMHIVWHL